MSIELFGLLLMAYHFYKISVRVHRAGTGGTHREHEEGGYSSQEDTREETFHAEAEATEWGPKHRGDSLQAGNPFALLTSGEPEQGLHREAEAPEA